MIRDKDLIFKILCDIEEDRDIDKYINDAAYDNYVVFTENDEVKFKHCDVIRQYLGHLELLADNGFIKGVVFYQDYKSYEIETKRIRLR
jgi:hypothetical protein